MNGWMNLPSHPVSSGSEWSDRVPEWGLLCMGEVGCLSHISFSLWSHLWLELSTCTHLFQVWKSPSREPSIKDLVVSL